MPERYFGNTSACSKFLAVIDIHLKPVSPQPVKPVIWSSSFIEKYTLAANSIDQFCHSLLSSYWDNHFLQAVAGRQTTHNSVVTVTLSGWSNLNEKQLLQQVLKDFEAKNPKIKVKYDAIADEYMDVLKPDWLGTQQPTYLFRRLEAPALMIPGVLEPLDNYITPEFDIADFEPTLLNAFQQDGKIYGLPKDFSTLALF